MEAVAEQTGFDTYSVYKYSGVEWLGDVPEHWEVVKSKFLWDEIINLTDNENETLLSVSQYTGVNINSDRARGETLVGYKRVAKDDLVVNIMLAWLGGLGLSPHNGIVSPAYAVYRLSKEANPQFLHYLYRTKVYLDEFARRSKGVVPSRWRMYTEDFGQVLTLLPPLAEQTSIANFLDQKTDLIDKAIAQKQKQIELLNERRQVLIHNAVTRGINSDVPLKDSGVEWIGEIPAHWEVKRLKFILNGKLKYGANESGVAYDISLPRYIRITDFSIDGKLNEDTKLSLTWKQGHNYLLKDGDILFARSGATVGKTYQFKSSMSLEKYYSYAGYIIKAEANEAVILSDFLYLYTTSSMFNKWKDSIFIKATIENIGADKYSLLPVILPPVSEQRKILSHFNNQSKIVSTANNIKNKEIERLKEYKATLVNSAVTGKIKVS